MKKVLALMAVLAIIYISYRIFRYTTLEKNLSDKIAKGAVLLDVRTATEYNIGHIDGSVNISLGSIRERYTELDTAQTYITYCTHGLRSLKVQSILEEKGFKKVYNGGTQSDLEAIIQEQIGQ